MVEHVSERPAPTLTGRLGQILDAIDSGVTVQDTDQRLVYVNDAAARLCGWSSAAEMLNASVEETLARFELIDEQGEPLARDVLPDRHVLAGESPDPLVIGFRIRTSGQERWALVQHEAPEPLQLVASKDANGVDNPIARKERLRAKISHFYFRDRVAPPTPSELEAAHHEHEEPAEALDGRHEAIESAGASQERESIKADKQRD